MARSAAELFAPCFDDTVEVYYDVNMERGRNIFDALASARTAVFEVTLGAAALAVLAKVFFYQSSPLVKTLFDYTSALSR